MFFGCWLAGQVNADHVNWERCSSGESAWFTLQVRFNNLLIDMQYMCLQTFKAQLTKNKPGVQCLFIYIIVTESKRKVNMLKVWPGHSEKLDLVRSSHRVCSSTLHIVCHFLLESRSFFDALLSKTLFLSSVNPLCPIEYFHATSLSPCWRAKTIHFLSSGK